MRQSVRELLYMNLRISRFAPPPSSSSIVLLQYAQIVQRLSYERYMLSKYRPRNPLCILSDMPVFNYFALMSSIRK